MKRTAEAMEQIAPMVDQIAPITDRIASVMERQQRTIITVAPDTSVTDAVALMNRHGIGSVLITEDGQLIGIFTERDVMQRIIATHRDPDTTPVSRVMTRDVITVSPAVTVSNAMRVMIDNRTRHLPVTSERRLLGLVSIGDLMRWILEDRTAQVKDLVGYICHA